MIVNTHEMNVLNLLTVRKSRASVAAIGHQYILADQMPQVQIKGIEALAGMVCDWSVAILEECISDPLKNYVVRRRALNCIESLLKTAVRRGYDRIGYAAIGRLAQTAMDTNGSNGQSCPALEGLCDHLSQAIADGHFGALPDF